MSFLILLAISVVISAVMHFGFKYYLRPGLNSFVSKVIIGWVGAWLGSPVFGQWCGLLSYKEVFVVPAILGSFALLIIMIDVVKTFKGS